MRMTPDRRKRLVGDMVRCSREIAKVVRRGREEFFDPDDVRNRTTVEHLLELLGEACQAVGQPFREANPGIPWAALRRLRFDSAHPYDDAAQPVSYEEVWRLVTLELPKIARQLERTKLPRASER